MTDAREVTFDADGGPLPGLYAHPAAARWIYVLAHGAGAGMRHPFLADVAAALAARDVATLRWEMPYQAAGRRRPDPPAVATAAVRAAIAAARRLAPGLRVVAGGKSFGGRMTSTALADAPDPAVAGLIFLGFPLHPANRPGTSRADHLAGVSAPMLLLQGTRDALATPDLLRPIVAGLGARATLVEIDGADHGFAVPRRTGRTSADVIAALADAIVGWLGTLPASA